MKLSGNVVLWVRSLIEIVGRHPFATGVMAIIGVLGFLLSLDGYQRDRVDAENTTEQIADVSQKIAAVEGQISATLNDPCDAKFKEAFDLGIYYGSNPLISEPMFLAGEHARNHIRRTFLLVCPDDQRTTTIRTLMVKGFVNRQLETVGFPRHAVYVGTPSENYAGSICISVSPKYNLVEAIRLIPDRPERRNYNNYKRTAYCSTELGDLTTSLYVQ